MSASANPLAVSADDSVPTVSAVDSAPTVSAVDSAPTPPSKPKVDVVTSLDRKYSDLARMEGYDVTHVKAPKLDELATNDAEKLLKDKKARCQAVLGKPSKATVYEDTKFSFVTPAGIVLEWPSYDVTRLSSIKPLIEWAKFLGCTRAKYGCSAILEMPDGRSFYFTVTRDVTMCEKGKGVGAIDPFTIPDGSDKPYSEMSEEERATFHARAELARQIAAKLQELGY